MSAYSTVSPDMLCKGCQFGHVEESDQGHTHVICRTTTPEHAVMFVVTKCSSYQRKEMGRIYDTACHVAFHEGRVIWREKEYHPWRLADGSLLHPPKVEARVVAPEPESVS